VISLEFSFICFNSRAIFGQRIRANLHIHLLADHTLGGLAALLRWAHRTGRQAQTAAYPLYRLRADLAALWNDYTPNFHGPTVKARGVSSFTADNLSGRDYPRAGDADERALAPHQRVRIRRRSRVVEVHRLQVVRGVVELPDARDDAARLHQGHQLSEPGGLIRGRQHHLVTARRERERPPRCARACAGLASTRGLDVPRRAIGAGGGHAGPIRVDVARRTGAARRRHAAA